MNFLKVLVHHLDDLGLGVVHLLVGPASSPNGLDPVHVVVIEHVEMIFLEQVLEVWTGPALLGQVNDIWLDLLPRDLTGTYGLLERIVGECTRSFALKALDLLHG